MNRRTHIERWNTINEIKSANRQAGRFFFSDDTITFFNSTVETGVLHGKYFITSERPTLKDPKRFNIRRVNEHGHIVSIGARMTYVTLPQAKRALSKLAFAKGIL